MKKTNKPIKNQPMVNGDNRLKNICAWVLIICILLATVGGILGTLSFFGVRTASAEEVLPSSQSYDTSPRLLSGVSYSTFSSSPSYRYGFLNLTVRFTFDNNTCSFYLGYNDGSTSTYSQYADSFCNGEKYVDISPCFSRGTNLRVPAANSSSQNYLRASASVSSVGWDLNAGFPITESYVMVVRDDYVDYRLYDKGSVVAHSSSSKNYILTFVFREYNSIKGSLQIYIPFDFVVSDNAPYILNTPVDTRYYNANSNDYYNQGYNNGYLDGSKDKNSYGNNEYHRGYNAGVESANKYSFLGLISAVIDAPVRAFTSLFNFEILGVNLSAFMFGLLTLALIIFIVKLFLGGGGTK